MFLAWNEIKNNKLRFTLVIGVLMLVSYLVFFLSGLANGLEDLNKEAVDKWEADGIILTEESDLRLQQSVIQADDYQGDGSEEYAELGQQSAIASNGDNKANTFIFGIHKDEFIMPNVTEGEEFADEGEVIADESLKQEGFAVGDELSLSSIDETLTIVGFTDSARFNAAPVLYTDFETLQTLQYGEAVEQGSEQVNAFVVRSNNLNEVAVDEELQVVDTQTFIENLPGYTEQNLTLSFMIYFLFVISAVILAIFLYVLTIQKVSIFGVMKAQGISSRYLAKSVIAQTFLLSLAGVIIGLVFTILTGYFLPPEVPVSFNYLDMFVYAVVLILVSVIGAFISVQTIVKIDPLKAIGG
ncbi:ABC transporter permease [Oceanobacillus kimchii]|uniref:ABC transporter permease n=1 Tax=Oceanobacillus kimchii TaxID=746691 RepID=UPI000346661B|nr:ABC transporter permease [Oceanobacillus kimchii]MCT1576789.1 ABC transporter permease [Oceanobacillus kimchii]MCT2134859.1 ABC transporter permease [Oceanobacillus kimchii]